NQPGARATTARLVRLSRASLIRSSCRWAAPMSRDLSCGVLVGLDAEQGGSGTEADAAKDDEDQLGAIAEADGGVEHGGGSLRHRPAGERGRRDQHPH